MKISIHQKPLVFSFIILAILGGIGHGVYWSIQKLHDSAAFELRQLVQDDPALTDDAMLAIRALKKRGFNNKIFHVKDGAEALDFIYCRRAYILRDKQNQPRLILLDLKMPKVTGMEVLQKIKSNPVTHKIPVVVLTSSKENPDVEKCYELGANSYIVKPVEFENFSKAVAEIGLYWILHNHSAL